MLKDAPPASMVYANVPIPVTQQYFYFEITVLNPGRDGSIGIGLATVEHNFSGMPGWSGGYGYHGDDGRKFSDENKGKGTGNFFKRLSLLTEIYRVWAYLWKR
jgi:hypothetical protein